MQLCELILLQGFRTSSDIPGVERLSISALRPEIGCVPEFRFGASEIGGSCIGEADPHGVFFVKGWTRAVCMHVVLLCAWESDPADFINVPASRWCCPIIAFFLHNDILNKTFLPNSYPVIQVWQDDVRMILGLILKIWSDQHSKFQTVGIWCDFFSGVSVPSTAMFAWWLIKKNRRVLCTRAVVLPWPQPWEENPMHSIYYIKCAYSNVWGGRMLLWRPWAE